MELHKAAQQVLLGVPRVVRACRQRGGVAIQANTVVTTPCTISGTWASGSQASRVLLCAQQFATISAPSSSGARTATSAIVLDTL